MRGELKKKGSGMRGEAVAWGGIAVVGKERIEAVARLAKERGVTQTTVCRMLLNEAIDKVQAQ